jgi:S-adenosylmethionine hydrolase
MPSYAAAQEDNLFCIIGSSGRLEILLKNGSAAALLGACRGDSIVLKKV